jgi:hypothetical protein
VVASLFMKLKLEKITLVLVCVMFALHCIIFAHYLSRMFVTRASSFCIVSF